MKVRRVPVSASFAHTTVSTPAGEAPTIERRCDAAKLHQRLSRTPGPQRLSATSRERSNPGTTLFVGLGISRSWQRTACLPTKYV